MYHRVNLKFIGRKLLVTTLTKLILSVIPFVGRCSEDQLFLISNSNEIQCYKQNNPATNGS